MPGRSGRDARRKPSRVGTTHRGIERLARRRTREELAFRRRERHPVCLADRLDRERHRSSDLAGAEEH